MAWLDALLAFAITMMVLSTIVSAIVEAGHTLLNQRSKGLERLMEHMFDKVIAPRLAGRMPADVTGSRFVKQMTDMRWLPIETNATQWKKIYYAIANKLGRVDKVQKLTTLEFLERVAESSVGAAVVSRFKKTADENQALGIFLEDLVSKFEDFGDNASTYFARRARMYSVIVGFILVFSINFSAIDMAKTLIQSESARSALIEQSDAIAEQLNEQLKRELEKAKNSDGGSVPNPEFDPKELERSIKEGVRTLQESQLPVGWQHAPWQSEQKNTAWEKFSEWITFGDFVHWAGSVLLGGLLVGLGGPFWFDTYRRLASLSSVARAFQSEVKQDGSQKAQAAGEQAGENRQKRLLRIFNTARQASDFAEPIGRLPLTDTGNTIQLGHIR